MPLGHGGIYGMRTLFFALAILSLLSASAFAQRGRVEARAAYGEPFGVGWVTVPLRPTAAELIDRKLAIPPS